MKIDKLETAINTTRVKTLDGQPLTAVEFEQLTANILRRDQLNKQLIQMQEDK